MHTTIRFSYKFFKINALLGLWHHNLVFSLSSHRSGAAQYAVFFLGQRRWGGGGYGWTLTPFGFQLHWKMCKRRKYLTSSMSHSGSAVSGCASGLAS